jgi:hypothetical protein
MKFSLNIDEESIKGKSIDWIYVYSPDELLIGHCSKYHYHGDLYANSTSKAYTDITGWVCEGKIIMRYCHFRDAENFLKIMLNQTERFRRLTNNPNLNFNVSHLFYKAEDCSEKKLQDIPLEQACLMFEQREIPERGNLLINL